MEFLSKQLKQIGGHLGGLTLSQRLALAASALVIVLGVALLLQWSGEPDLVPLLDQPLKAEELTAITRELSARGAPYRTVGSQIMVRPDERTRLQGAVAQSGAMPANTAIGFAKLIDEANMWLPRDESRWQRKIALGNELAKVLAQFDGVTEARVFIDQPERHGFGEAAAGPTASVFLKTASEGALDKPRVAAIAALVSGAVEGLKPEAVRIVDSTTGRPYRVPADDEALPYDLHDLRRQKEDYYGRKILAQLGYITGVLVGVNVEMDMERRTEHQEKFGPPQTSEEETTSSESSGTTTAANPGVRPNTAASLPGGGSNESTTSEQSHTTLMGERDKQVTDRRNLPGVARRITASVNVPRSHFVAIYKSLNAGKEPSAKELEPIVMEEEKKIRGQVKPLIAATADEQVEVSWYHDAAATATTRVEAVPTGDKPVSAGMMIQSQWKTIALGAVVLVSLFMVLQMGRKAIPKAPPPPAPAAAATAPQPGGVDDAADGEAGGGTIIKHAHQKTVELEEPELDEAMARTKAMVGEIRKTVGDDPETAASILERWITQPR
ncbi:MAG: flagellar M-ring protein FliF C-terminal domain-containing protein [Phycisphaerae bacterium]